MLSKRYIVKRITISNTPSYVYVYYVKYYLFGFILIYNKQIGFDEYFKNS